MYSGGPLDGEVFSVQMQANGVLRVTDNNQNIVRMNDLPLDIGIWNHITISVPENDTFFSISLFKNGIPSNETYIGSDIVINTASNVVDFFPKFIGLASDIRYFDYNLCGGEVEKIYNDRQTTLSIDDPLQNDKNQIMTKFKNNEIYLGGDENYNSPLYIKNDNVYSNKLNVTDLYIKDYNDNSKLLYLNDYIKWIDTSFKYSNNMD